MKKRINRISLTLSVLLLCPGLSAQDSTGRKPIDFTKYERHSGDFGVGVGLDYGGLAGSNWLILCPPRFPDSADSDITSWVQDKMWEQLSTSFLLRQSMW